MEYVVLILKAIMESSGEGVHLFWDPHSERSLELLKKHVSFPVDYDRVQEQPKQPGCIFKGVIGSWPLVAVGKAVKPKSCYDLT